MRGVEAHVEPRVEPNMEPRVEQPSLVASPSLAAHRGASGYRPEHTLDAYRTAIRMGADEIELDLVSTRDGVLVARHDLELSRTTDIADHADLAHLHSSRVVDGEELTGWFVDDLGIGQLKRLTARERWPQTRPGSAEHDGVEGIATLTEVLAMAAAESVRRGRAVGLLLELKHPAYFAARGLGLEEPLLRTLARHGLDHPWARVSIISFDADALRQLAKRTRLPLVQLLERHDPVTPAHLALIDEYADGIGPHTALVLDPDGTPTTLVRDAHRLGLTVHPWTVRAENRFLPAPFADLARPDAAGDVAGFAVALLAAGVDGLTTDQPDLVAPAMRRRRAAS